MSFFDQLQQASFRGVPFGVLNAEGRFGRRVAEHEYPYRDRPWIEDMGRSTRRISFIGFLIENSLVYGGGSVIAQRERMIAACETKGPGTLVHPTLGRLTVSIPDGGFAATERFDEGRYFEIGLTCIETGERKFPEAASASTDAAGAAAVQTDLAAAQNFVASAQIAIARGSAVVKQAVSTFNGWVDQISLLAQTATGLYTMVATLPGNFGRFFPGGTKGYAGQLEVPGAPTTITGLIQSGTAARANVAAVNASLLAAAAGTDAQATADAAIAAVAALLAATADPGVAVRLLASLEAFYPDQPTTTSPIGLAMAAMQTAAAALARRVTLSALVRAAALYQPTSRDDAARMRDKIAALLDAEILVAGDSDDDASYSALRTLRAAMVSDLNGRGAALPPMQTFTFAANLPSLVLAQRLYQDPARNDELTTQANPPHPAFMPLQFAALGS